MAGPFLLLTLISAYSTCLQERWPFNWGYVPCIQVCVGIYRHGYSGILNPPRLEYVNSSIFLVVVLSNVATGNYLFWNKYFRTQEVGKKIHFPNLFLVEALNFFRLVFTDCLNCVIALFSLLCKIISFILSNVLHGILLDSFPDVQCQAAYWVVPVLHCF